ncbi:LuxR C-terminal-related transcriptional regulator [Sphingobacterium siyangense]|uniref:LuxR C-terminal-related transcriptional regulator n=1 Tax=Sphingobacterium siyangense TaxID=459529 RepID=UPI001964086B|nr:LuxR C-terminal-related transcriptional regulator [Sphingobacterium siyangense]QRY58988.1 hypothetical protein JVX97_05905 [Sphingobacterium siyangense]
MELLFKSESLEMSYDEDNDIFKGKWNNCDAVEKLIADILSISCETVKTHRRNLLRKLQYKNMSELMRFQIFL